MGLPTQDLKEPNIDYSPLDNLEGALVANEYKTEGVILINNSKEIGTKERQRFTLGHEIGHFMIPHHGHEMSCSISDDPVNQIV
jgi:Zn-dependent peptidase ImmA (M78 family)